MGHAMSNKTYRIDGRGADKCAAPSPGRKR